MRKSALLVVMGALAILSFVVAQEGDKGGKTGHKEDAGAAKKVALTGEVMDLHCYMIHPDKGQGTSHAKCAQACIKKGIPAGILVDGQLYVLLGKGHDAAKDAVADHGGSVVTVTGTVLDHDGLKAIQIEKIEYIGAADLQEGEDLDEESHEGHDH